MKSTVYRAFLLVHAVLLLSACSGGGAKPTSPANGLSNAGQIPIPCPPGQNSMSYSDATGLHIVNCTAQNTQR